MDSENYEVIYCEDDGEYRISCSVCDNSCIETCYKKHPKSGTHIRNFYERQ